LRFFHQHETAVANRLEPRRMIELYGDFHACRC
jgi:hypothetical protein